MRFATCLCVLLVVAVLVSTADARKTFSSRRKSGGNNRRGGSTSNKQKPPPQPATPHKTETTNTNFLNSERAGTSHGSVNTHKRPDPFSNPSAPQAPKNNVPQTNGPIGFDNLGHQGNQKPLGFDKVNSEVQQKHNVPSAPAYPAGSPAYPGKPAASAPNGPPPAYGSSGTGTHTGSYEPPPAYPGRPVNAPPVYSANNPNYGNTNPGYPNQQGGYPNQQVGYPNQQGGYPNQQGGYPNQQGGYPNQQGGYTNHQGGYPNQQGGYPNQQGGYPNQQGGFQQGSYPQQQGSFSGQSYPGQQNFGYPNSGGSFGNQGYNQGFGSYGNSHMGGYGQSNPGFGGNPYGGSPFGQSNSYGGSPFGSSGFGGNMFGGSGYGNSHYGSNNFGFSNNPGFFGSNSGGYNNYGYRKKGFFGGRLPIPIPIPIPIPLGGFGGFGGRSYNHRVLDTFVKDSNVSSTDNTTTNVYILNNSTVTPCTTDQFIYDSLNVTVMSCTAGNCTAIKVFTTTNASGEVSTQSAGITMCLEPNATFSSFADNINPKVSDVHRYWMRVCKEGIALNQTGNVTQQDVTNATVKVSEVTLNETEVSEGNSTTSQPTTLGSAETTTPSTTLNNATATSTTLNSTSTNSSGTNSSICETFDCSWIEMCLPSVEIENRCATPDCPPTKTGYQPCVRIKMCKSPNTPISTFAILNTTISRIDQFNNITSVNDLFNLTLISYIPPTLNANCSQNATDPGCQLPTLNLTPEVCAPGSSAEAVGAESSTPNNSTVCIPPVLPVGGSSAEVNATSTEASSTTPIR